MYKSVRALRDKGRKRFQSVVSTKESVTTFVSSETGRKMSPIVTDNPLFINGEQELSPLPRAPPVVDEHEHVSTVDHQKSRRKTRSKCLPTKVHQEDEANASRWLAAAKRVKVKPEKPPSYHMQVSPKQPKSSKKEPKRVHVERQQVIKALFKQSDDWEIQFDLQPQEGMTPEAPKT